MSWAEIKKINSDISVPLDKQIEVAEINGKRCKVVKKYRVEPVRTLNIVHQNNSAFGIKNNIMYQIDGNVTMHINHVIYNSGNYWSNEGYVTSTVNTNTHAIVVNDRYIYFMGGGTQNTGNNGTPSGRAYDFDLKTYKGITNPIGNNSGSWVQHTMVEYNGDVFILGGILYTVYNGAWTNLLNKNLRLNLASNGNYGSATIMNDLPQGFSVPSSVVFDNEIHLFHSNAHYKSSDGNTWTQLTNPPFSLYVSNKAVVYNGEIHVFRSTAHYKSSDGITWTQLNTISFQINDTESVFVAHGRIYILGADSTKKGFYAYKDGEWLDYAGASLVESGVTYEPLDGSESINIP